MSSTFPLNMFLRPPKTTPQGTDLEQLLRGFEVLRPALPLAQQRVDSGLRAGRRVGGQQPKGRRAKAGNRSERASSMWGLPSHRSLPLPFARRLRARALGNAGCNVALACSFPPSKGAFGAAPHGGHVPDQPVGRAQAF